MVAWSKVVSYAGPKKELLHIANGVIVSVLYFMVPVKLLIYVLIAKVK